jgi:hypothetical protein
VQADRCPSGAAAEFYQVTDLVHDQKAVAFARVRGGQVPACERVGDVAAVLNLANQLIPGGPDGQDAARIGVPKGIRGKLAHGEHQVEDTVRVKANTGGLLRGECP